ncbi:hypothetical protein HPP92_028188 [Vanilla planifolia]|uniref:AB hydrolase-1 domain-containing protein n=1 Tax=Vanilla planifolia TaxID=51239 RepID=A0A835U348_VANPL|nr:hypothetical protein HPP92_028188 [Vanilla planifolia]
MRGATESIISAASILVFAILDFVDWALCFFYRFLDSVLDDASVPCYCRSRGSREEQRFLGDEGGEGGISETLLGRRSLFRDLGSFAPMDTIQALKEKKGAGRSPRWSDCACPTCVSWQHLQGKGEETLHMVVKEPSPATQCVVENVICIHGFLSSSSIWEELVFPNLSEAAKPRTRMFAMDLLGFGKSPKPAACLYTTEEHIAMIERSVIKHFNLDSFHIVAHSMGCILALGLAAKHPKSVKSITLVAPPYFSSAKDDASHNALNKLAKRTIWPPLQFASSVMSWYEHIGRTVCFILCSNHSTWESFMKLLTWKSNLPRFMTDVTKHTHHSAWHTMHNVLCGGAKFADKYLEALQAEGVLIKIIQGTKDHVVPLECSSSLKARAPAAQLQFIHGAGHISVIRNRRKDFTRDLEETWFSA